MDAASRRPATASDLRVSDSVKQAAPLASNEAVSRGLSRIDWDFADENPSSVNMRLNGVHWYPATFIAPLIGTLLDILAPEPPVSLFDPFSGSGTAPIEAWYRGHRAYGSDSSAFAVALAKSRVQLIRHASADTGTRLAQQAQGWCDRVARDSHARSEAERFASILPEAARWFVPDALRDIAAAKWWIETEAPQDWRETLRVLLSSILKRSSIVREYHYTYIVDRSRVENPWRDNPQLAETFTQKLITAFHGAAHLRTALRERGRIDLDGPPAFDRCSATEIKSVDNGAADVIVTSPPYFGMNDYVRSQYLTSLVYPSADFERDLGEESGSRRQRRSEPALAKYLADMDAAFDECFRILKPDGLLALFLGHSRSRLAREADVVGRLGTLLDARGFEAVWKGERRIRFRKITSTPSSSEFVWIFRRT
jgi:hypothetical protein